jgi:hypothetical protein
LKALVCEALGPPESVLVVDAPEPVAGPGEAIV